MTLETEISARRASIHTDAYAMSIGELINLYRDNEIDIHPEFQRFFRWSEAQKSRLIESLLLGIPIPSIFVQQREDGVWDVIDGLQRLSTIFELAGILKNENSEKMPPLILQGTSYLPSLKGKKWGDGTKGSDYLSKDQELLIKRSKLDVQIVLRESDPNSKYELFQRLNTGGSQLSEQELRNCLLIMVNRDFYNWVIELSRDEEFNRCIALTDKAIDEQYNVELVLRFLVLRKLENKRLSEVGDVHDFLTEEAKRLALNAKYDRKREGEAFYHTFRLLAKNMGETSFLRYVPAKQRFSGGFLISSFEIIALGLGYHHEEYTKGGKVPDIVTVAQKVWTDRALQTKIGSGVRASTRIPYTVPYGRDNFRP